MKRKKQNGGENYPYDEPHTMTSDFTIFHPHGSSGETSLLVDKILNYLGGFPGTIWGYTLKMVNVLLLAIEFEL